MRVTPVFLHVSGSATYGVDSSGPSVCGCSIQTVVDVVVRGNVDAVAVVDVVAGTVEDANAPSDVGAFVASVEESSEAVHEPANTTANKPTIEIRSIT